MLAPMSSLVWVELDSEAPGHNLSELGRCLRPGVLMCAVVKSNAYGHGVDRMLPLLGSADWFAVNSLDEGLELRELGVEKPVLLLGHVPLRRLRDALDADLRLTIFNGETLDRLEDLCSGSGSRARVHVKVETGTGRQGVMSGELTGFIERIHSIDSIELEGFSTHFANIEDTLNHSYAEAQLEEFERALEKACSLGPRPPVVHTACSAATILFPETHFDMVRAGISIYGLWPSRETYLSALTTGGPVPGLRPVLTWKTRVAQLKQLPRGSFVGYGCTCRTSRESRVAVLPVGYADGYSRSLSNRSYVLIHGQRAPILGRVCMNIIMVDVTDIEGVALEDEVVLLGSSGDERISAELMAEWSGTINYEVVTRISPCLERRVAETGELDG